MPDLKQSTATTRMVFMTDSSDHVTGKTGLTLTITASKAGGAFASINPTVVDRGSGWYSLALTTAHTDTLGDLVLHLTSTGADPTDVKHNVVAGSLDADVSSRLAPTVASRTLDISAGGEAGIDLANVGSPTTTLNLSGTTISTGQGIASVSGSVGSVTGAVGSVTGAVGSVAGNVGGNVTGNVGGNVAGKVLGGGSGTITGTGVNANIASVDPSLTADGTAQAGGASTITLASSSATPTDYYGSATGGRVIEIVAGTGVGQSRKIVAYNGTTKVATVDVAWATVPDSTSKYALGPYAPAATTSLGSTAPAGWINAASVATDAVTKVQSGLASSNQIPTGFATIAITAGAFDAAVLANAPTGGGSGTDPLSNPVPGTYPPGTLGYIVGNLADQADLGATIAATPVGIKTGGITTSSYATGAAPLTAAGITTLSTAVNATKTGVDTINGTGVKLKTDGLDLIDVESTTNIPQAISVMLAALSGPVSIDDNGDDTYTLTFKAPGTNTTRISMVTTAAGERLTTTVSPPA